MKYYLYYYVSNEIKSCICYTFFIINMNFLHCYDGNNTTMLYFMGFPFHFFSYMKRITAMLLKVKTSCNDIILVANITKL